MHFFLSECCAPSNDGLTTGQKVGIGIGVPAMIIVIGAAILFYIRWRKKK